MTQFYEHKLDLDLKLIKNFNIGILKVVIDQQSFFANKQTKKFQFIIFTYHIIIIIIKLYVFDPHGLIT